MKGDFTRDTFRPERRYSSVRMQQGRVQMDADWNEAEDIRLARERTEIRDVVGPCGAPLDDAGFEISSAGGDLSIGPGRLYVEGILVQNDGPVAFGAQPDLPGATLPEAPSGSRLLVYLDVWEEHVTALEDGLLREVALNGPDTATRLRPVWQVKATALPEGVTTCAAAMDGLPGPTDARLAARAKTLDDSEACTVKPGARYKRLENQLYRVEVETAGDLATARFKWSRDNGTVASRFTVAGDRTLTVDRVGRDGVLSFGPGGWLELTDRRRELRGEPGQFVRVKEIAGNDLILDPAGPTVDDAQFGEGKKARRWDSAGPFAFVPDIDGFMLLEDGVAVALSGNDFRKGDYWLVPARTVTADVEWPDAAPQPPKGVVHRRCPLAIATFGAATVGAPSWEIVDCRNPFVPLADVIGMFYGGGDGQVATPNATGLPVLAQAPTVGVARGKRPVQGAKVRWTVLAGGGSVTGDPIKTTGPDGLVACDWNLGSDPEPQRLRAELLDSEGDPTHIPIVFTATLPKPSGGTTGCCRSIGKDGDYPTIRAAIEDLVFKRRLAGVCLCLMPGEHPWPEDIEGEPPSGFSLEIAGLRDASTIVAKESLELSGIARFVLRDLAVQAARLRLSGIGEIDVDFVEFTVGAEFLVEGVRTFRMNDATIGRAANVAFSKAQDVSIVRCAANVASPEGHAISFKGSRRLSIEDCLLVGAVARGPGATLAIDGVASSRIVGNDVAARRTATDDPTGPKPSLPTTGGVVGTFVARLGEGLTAATTNTQVKKLLGATADERKTNARAISNLVADAPLLLGREGAEKLAALAGVLADPQADTTRVTAAVGDLNAAVADARSDTGILARRDALGIALQIGDGDGACLVENNLLRGDVALYGDPGPQRIDADVARQYQSRAKQFGGRETWGSGSLTFVHNLVVSVSLASTFVDGEAQKLFFEKGTFETSVFRTATIADNAFGDAIELLFLVGALTGNVFPSLGGSATGTATYAGIVVARNGAYTGNVSTTNLVVVSTAINPAPAGNVGVTFS